MFREHIRLRIAARRNDIPEEELLRWAANRELNLAVWADGWFAAPSNDFESCAWRKRGKSRASDVGAKDSARRKHA